MNHWIISIYPILPAALGPKLYLASNRNEYHKQEKKMFWRSKARPVHMVAKFTAICEPIV
jgi:hypothetical protein